MGSMKEEVRVEGLGFKRGIGGFPSMELERWLSSWTAYNHV